MAEGFLPGSHGQPSETINDLNTTLDNLWSQYLSLLDQYQTLRQQLNDNLSVGHLNIAKANFSNANRVRYGRDYYDERMQASTCISMTEADSSRTNFTPAFELLSTTGPKESTSAGEGSEDDNISQQPSIDPAQKEVKPKTRNKIGDPLNWFGLLVPPALKASQTAFRDAIVTFPRLASLDLQMRGLEIEIRRTRKKVQKLK